jgi:hypothetical protein
MGHRRIANIDSSGLKNARVELHRSGHRGSRLVYVADRSNLEWLTDPETGLSLFRIQEVFLDQNSVFLGFGLPNVFTMVWRPADDSREAGWDKLAAYMFWRQGAYVADTGGRVQAGVFFELRGLPEEARDRIRHEMYGVWGMRGPSCAWLNARILTSAGFRLGNGGALDSVVRPTKLASLIWRYGLEYDGIPVEVRIVLTGDKGVGDHFEGLWWGVWGKEFLSACRTVKKQFSKRAVQLRVPKFPVKEIVDLGGREFSGRPTLVGINRPRWLGVKFAFLTGQQPIYTVQLDGIDQVEELQEPLQVPTDNLDRATRIKRRIFSPRTVRMIDHFRTKSFDYYDGVQADAALEMLTPSPGPDRETAVLYNCVVVLNSDGTAEARITGLKNQHPRTKKSRWIKFNVWALAKHLMLSVYGSVPFAGEAWTYIDADGSTVLCLNNNSGSYQTSRKRLFVMAEYLRKVFGVRVRVFPVDESGEAQAH